MLLGSGKKHQIPAMKHNAWESQNCKRLTKETIIKLGCVYEDVTMHGLTKEDRREFLDFYFLTQDGLI